MLLPTGVYGNTYLLWVVYSVTEVQFLEAPTVSGK